MKRVKIIEDDDAIRTELKTLLSTNGFQPMEEGTCDLILMDVNLPGESGYALCRKLRQASAFFLMPFVLPLIMTVPLGVLFGKVYELWNFSGLSGQKALETAVLISLAVADVYALYFLITYRIACNHVICHGDEEKKI